jgi:hypothetical protein
LCIQANSKASSLGGQQVLDCHLQFPQGMPVNYVIEWKKDGLKDPVLLQFYGYPPNVNELYTDRVRLVNGISLEISHIQEYDEGWYECKVKFIDGVENDKKKSNGTWIYLNVNSKYKIYFFTRNNSMKMFIIKIVIGASSKCQKSENPEFSIILIDLI